MKRTMLAAFIAIIFTPTIIQTTKAGTTDLSAKRHHHRTSTDANGSPARCAHNTVATQTAYGITICVDPVHASKFVAFFASLHARGVKVTNIVCQAYGHAPGSNHLGGGACDVNQRARNRTIPAMYHAGDLIRAAGLYDGCAFRDCGHVEAMRGLGHYGGTTLAARSHIRHRTAAVQSPQAAPSGFYMARAGAGI